MVILSVAACVDRPVEWSADEVARIPDQTGVIDAVLFERNGGATTSLGYVVYVVPRGQAVNPAADSVVASLYHATRSDSSYGVNLRWTGANELAVEYLTAWQAVVRDSSATAGQRDVRIVLRDGVADAQAPGGGMLYNLRKQAK
jgi:hypothetical protein